MKSSQSATYEVVKVLSKSHGLKSSELFGSRADAIRKNVTSKKNFMQQKGTGQECDNENGIFINTEEDSNQTEKVDELAWEEVRTQEQCEEYIKHKYPEYGENLCKAISMHITDEAIKQAEDKDYRSYLARHPNERLSKSTVEQQQQWDWMKEVKEMKDKFKSQQL